MLPSLGSLLGEERQRKLLKSQSRNLPEGTDLHPSDDLFSREVEKDDNG